MNKVADKKILVIDDDRSHLESMVDALGSAGFQILAAENGQKGWQMIQEASPDLVITDLRMRGMDGLEVLQSLKKSGREVPVIVMTAFTSMETAIDAIQKGAYDYISKPFKLDQLRLVINRALEQAILLKENRRLKGMVRSQQKQHPTVVGRSPEMVEVYKLVAKVAPLNTTVLIQGESGTGKEVVAKMLHQTSGRTGPFLAVNCGALAEGVLESELFGHVKGAFTGAQYHKTGIFEAAAQGTCFLDELSNTSLTLQSKLLRVIEEGELMPVGSSKPININCRIIAASNQPLDALVKEKKFRHDLYFRLNVIAITLPPLRQRKSDIPILLDYFIEKAANHQGKRIAVHESVEHHLKHYHWPGNVRELAHAVERAVALNTSGMLSIQDFQETVGAPSLYREEQKEELDFRIPAHHLLPLEQLELAYIQWLMEKVEPNKSRVSELLGIDRRTLYRILERDQSKKIKP